MLAIIQARMNSKRLPGKVLRPVAGRPMLKRVYERLSQSSELTTIMVSTSKAISDNAIYEFCTEQEILVHRGPLDRVAERLLDCARSQGADEFVRISGDSPLIDPALVDWAVVLQRETSCDLSTNVQVRSFPRGQSVEVIRTDSLTRAWKKMAVAQDFEHVTPYFYAHPDDFTIENFSCDERVGNLQLSIDTLEDLNAVETVLGQLGDHFSWRDAVSLMYESPGF